MKTIKDLIKRYTNLETIEEKSFWTIAPMIAAVGLVGLTTGTSYGSSLPVLSSALLCLIIPIALMMFVYRKRNYHIAYPLLCVFIGGVSVPLTFVLSGGFLSGMPLFCVVSTAVSALCYDKKQRMFALISCLVGNAIAFYYVYFNGSPFPFDTTTKVYNDIIFGYIFASIGTFFAINSIINEVRKYKFSQDALQQYFDIEVRKEILKKAVDGDLNLKNGEKKVVILFADISNFTSVTERMSSDYIEKYLRQFFTIAGECIHETGGIMDKYIGDCVMAYWFEKDDENCVYNAVKAVLAMKKKLTNQAEDIYREFGTELNFSAGISYGDVIFGDIGSNDMHDYTIIGDAVNTASRIEDRAVSGEILMSGEAAEKVKDLIELDRVENNLYLKGKNQSINLYRVLGYKGQNENEIIINNNYEYTLYICGCRGSFPVSGIRFSEYGGETSCYVLKKDDYAIIVDCGTGLKNAVDILKDCNKIDILLTHVHYDHILGLLMAKLPSNAKITFYGYFNGWEPNSNTLENFMEHPYWPAQIIHTDNVSINLGEKITLDSGVTAEFYKSDHPDGGCVIKLMCGNKKVCFFADCEDANKLDPQIARNADLLFFDGMYDDSEIANHIGWGHGTWQGGVRFAKALNIKKLIVTHHDPETGDHTLHIREDIARTDANNVSFAKAGDRILI